MDSIGPLRIGAVLLAFVAVIVALVTWRSRRPRTDGPDGAHGPDGSEHAPADDGDPDPTSAIGAGDTAVSDRAGAAGTTGT
jgi:hypothetical protein